MSTQAYLYSLFLLITLALGLFAGRRIRSGADFHVASRQMSWPVLVGTFIASNVSIAFFLGATNMAARRGYAFWCAYFTTAIGFLFAIAVVGVLVRRWAERYPIQSFGDFLATRYPSQSGKIRTVAGILIGFIYLPYMAAQFTGLAAISASVLDLPFRPVQVALVLFVVTYTLWGGMLGVVWTDTFMFLVLLLGILLAVPIAISNIGESNVNLAWERVLEELPDTIFQGVHPGWGWVALLGQTLWIFAFAAEPHLVTRFLTARDERTIVKALPVCVGLTLVLYCSSVPMGLLGRLTAPNLPPEGYYYIQLAKQHLGAWIGGFALAGIAAAGFSTCSTEMIVTSQTISRDLYRRYLRPRASAKEMVLASRLAVFAVGLATLGLVLIENLGIFWLVFLSVSLLISAFFAPVVLGLFWNRGSSSAALYSMIVGPVCAGGAFWINRELDWGLTSMEGYAGLAGGCLTYWLISFLHPANPEEQARAASIF